MSLDVKQLRMGVPYSVLRDTTVGIPESIRHHFPGNSNAKAAIYYRKSHHQNDPRVDYSGVVLVLLVPHNGAGGLGAFEIAASEVHRFDEPKRFAEEAKNLLRDRNRLTGLLEEHARDASNFRPKYLRTYLGNYLRV